MANKTLKIDLQFNANVKEAQRQMQQLQQSLNQLVAGQSIASFNLTPQLREAQQSAMDLKIALNNAMNVDTGKLNLNKFQSELNRSGKSIQQYAQQLQALGPSGVRAFQQVAQAVAQADTKMFNLSGGAKKLMDTLGNTVRWQLTSSAIHGVMSAFSDTISYAKDLDTSLNNIRIVTGKSADQMARFAKEANSMAKQLSTTTTKYSDASLIYYQQGLNEKEVKERTDTTIKLANVTGESAEQVSQWMTAVWNNFDNGSEKLEYYADVMAKLGAATASSADEIATGLEKFAAVAETVGLSYEYATSALATVTAETRQSADVVGTAFKTLFARIEGLKLGETLEDGTDLNQYSLALQTVGVNIKDANGELKDMDTILDQTGARWQILSKDQQVALAQQVAGIRQYNQFMALMENWDVMQKNLKLTEQANGALEEQNRIYEESMTASQERMKAASEELKALIIGGDDLIPLYNFAGGALEVITELLEAFGGLPTIILGVATALTKLYQPQIASFFSQTAIGLGNIKSAGSNFIHGKGFKIDNTYQRNAVGLGAQMAIDTLPEGAKASYYAKENAAIEEKMIELGDSVNQNVKQRLEWTFELIKKQEEYLLLIDKEIELQKQATGKKQDELQNQGMSLSTVSNLTSQATSLGQMKGYGKLAAQKIEQVANLGNLDQTSREDIRDDVKSSLASMKKAATTGLAGEAGVGLNMTDINIKVDGQMKSVADATLQAEQALDSYAKNGTEDLNSILILIQKINEAMTEVGTDALKANAENTLEAPTFAEMGQKYDVPNKPVSLAQIEKDLGDIDGRASLKEVKSSKKSEDPINKKSLKEQINNIKKLQKEQSKYNQSSTEYKKLQKDIDKATNKLNGDMKKFIKTQDQNQKTNKKGIKLNEEMSDSVNSLIEGAEKQGEAIAGSSDASEKLGDEINTLNEDLDNGGSRLAHWSDTLAIGVSGLSSYLMGLSMLTSSFEQLGRGIAGADENFGSLISNLSSMMMGIMMIIPAIKTMNESTGKLAVKIGQEIVARKMNKLAMQAEKQQGEQGIITKKKEQQEDKKVVQEKKVSIIHKIFSAFAGIAEDAGKGMPGWIEAAASLAMVAPIALMVGAGVISGISGAKQQNKEAKQEEVSKGAESLETINENQELAESVTDLTEEYNALRNAGESTADVLEDMREKIPELIESYKELAKTMGTHIDTGELEKAYEVFLATGDTSLLEKVQENLDKDIKEKERTIAETTVQNATELMIDSARKGRGHLDGNTYHIDLGEPNAEINKELEKVFDESWDGDNIRIDTTNSAEVLNYYEKAIKARDKLKELGYEDTATYKRLADDVKEMAEYAESAYTAQESKYEVLEKELLALDTEGLDKISATINNTTVTGDQIKDLQTYELYRDELIKSLIKEYEMTEAQAQAYLETTDALGHLEEAYEFFKKGGLGFNKDASEQTVKKIKEWFADLPEEERTLAMTIDYTTVATKEDAAAALEEARKKAEEAAILQEVEGLEVDTAVFETYTEGLVELNSELDENENLTKQIALNNLKISKGLTTLTKSWDDTFEVIQKGNKASLEYAEAIGEVKKAFEEMFGVKPSTEYIEKYSNEINRMANGNLDSLQKLQDALAEDYILNMEYSTAINEDWSGTISDAQNQLRDLLDSIDTSVEIGKDSTLSQDYLNQVQSMLDAGVIAEDQLEQLFRVKGFELNITGWKNMPGPVKRTTQKTYDGFTGKEESYKVIEEQEDVRVPIINGDTSGLKSTQVSGTANVATVTKSTDKRVIDTSAAEEKADKAKDRRKKLENELDRYHEINEIISDTERELDKLGKAKDRAFGADKLALMNQEIDKQKEFIKNNKQLLKDAEEYAKQDKANLIANTASHLTLNFDEYGRIANYETLQQDYIDRLKANVNNDKAFENIEKEYEAFENAASKYEESLNKVEDQQQAVIDEQNELADLALEKIEFKVQLKVDATDDDLKYIEFLMQTIEDDAFAAADAIGLLGQEAQATFEKITATEEGIAEVMATIEEQGYITDKQAEFLRNARDELIDYNAELLELRNTVHDKLTEAYDAWNEKLQENADIIDHYGSIIENYKNIIDIVGKDNLGISDETLAKMREAQVNNANDALRASKATLDANKETLAQMEAARETATNPEDIAKWDEQIKNAQEKVREATEEFMGDWETALQTAADAFAESVEQIVETFSESVSGIYKNLDELQEAFDRQKETDERYLDTYEKTYEISKLNRQIAQSIDKTSNVGSQKELRDLQKQLLDMNEAGVEVSQRDIEYMQKKYDLMVAEQAFKDAQNAKSVVRLQRDSEGNFGYVYTADQNAVDNAQQNYEDKLYAMQKFGDESLLEIQEQIIATNQEFADALLAIQENSNLSTEEKKLKAEEITQYYTKKLRYWTDEANDFMLRGQELNETYNANMASNFHNTLIGQMYPNLISFQGYYEESTGAMETASEEFTKAVEAHEIRYDKALQLAGTSTDNFENTVKTELGKVETESSSTADSVEDMAKEINDALNGKSVTSAITAVKNFQEAYSSKFSTIRQENLNTITSIGNLISKYGELETAAIEAKAAQDKVTTGGTYTGRNLNGQLESNNPNTTILNTNSNHTATIKQFGVYRDPSTGKFQDVVQLSDSNRWYGYNKADGKSIGDELAIIGPVQTYDEKNIIVDQDPPYEVGDYVKTNGSVYYYSKSGNGKVALFTPTTGGSLQSPMLRKSLSKSKIEEKYTNPNTSQNYYRIGQHWYKEEDLLSAYDTGGYTGEWGPEGRLAMLHQKEIVLNAHDTENFLSAIGIVRDISDQIEKNALTMQYRNTLNNYNANINKNRDILEQNVHITAEFPNATNHTEIEEAFRNLSNLASQYANRKF